MVGLARRLRRRLVPVGTVLLILAGPAAAQTAGDEAARCETAAARAAASGGVPVPVLQAISLAETGRARGGRLSPWPWTVNREGQGYWFATRAEALAFARASLAEGRTSIDVGCFQINYRWHAAGFGSLEEMFDPEAGARYAAGFLRRLYRETGAWPAAAGAYHSRTPALAQRYRARFERILATVDATPGVLANAQETPRRSRTRMARRPLIITIERGAPGPAAPVSEGLEAQLRRTGATTLASAAGRPRF